MTKVAHNNTIVLYSYACRLISFVEFQAFEALLCLPDSVYVLAFQLFDTNSSGFVTYGELRVTAFASDSVLFSSTISNTFRQWG